MLLSGSGNGALKALIVHLSRQIASTTFINIDGAVSTGQHPSKVQRPTSADGFEKIKS